MFKIFQKIKIKKIITLSAIFVIAASLFFGTNLFSTKTASADWFATGGIWQYRKPLVIDRRKVNTATGTTTPLTNFPVLVSITDTDLKNYASTTGADILFTSVDGKTKLNHEIESYNSATGVLLAWVQIPSLISTADTAIYMYFGNATATSQQSVASTWDSNFKTVYHMADNAANSTVTDSTSYNDAGTYNAANTSAKTASGQIGRALTTSVSTDKITSSNATPGANQTMEAWVKPASTGLTQHIILQGTSDYYLRLQQRNNHYQTAYGTGAQWGTTINTNSNAPDSTNWTHMVSVHDAVNNRTLLYINGSLDINISDNYTMGSTAGFIIGQFGNNSNNFYGSIDEVKISSTVRSADWIKTEYLNQSNPGKFYSLSGSQVENRPAATPFLKSRGGVQMR